MIQYLVVTRSNRIPTLNYMKSKVYFIRVESSENSRIVGQKLKRLLEESRILDYIGKDDRVALKAHFGEEGNRGYIDAEYAGIIAEKILHKGATAFLCDANTLYRGRRTNAVSHRELAFEHGFTREVTGVDVVIPDDTIKENTIDIPLKHTHIKSAKIARLFMEAGAILAVSHFKGHLLSGFGGALKNIGMGCATREGKLAQHCDVTPVFYEDKCVGCGACEKICPAGVFHIQDKKSVMDRSKCIGCGSCVGACPTSALFIDLKEGGLMQEKMVEYASAVLSKQKAGFINFAIKINQECDCWNMETPRIAPDAGIFASRDPVAIDKACLDMVTKISGSDVFKTTHPDQDGTIQLACAQKLGLGSLDYELVSL